MSKFLTKFANLEAYNAEVDAETLECPNVSLIQSTGAVKYMKSNPPIGIGIKGVDGGYYTLDEWNALETKPAAMGVYVKQGADVGFVIHGTVNSSVKWSNTTTVQISGVTTTTNQAVALTDFKGRANTDAVLNALSLAQIADAPLFTWARDLKWADNSTGGYVPSMGEANLIKNNLDQINACRTALGQAAIVFTGKYVWTSTQYRANNAWNWYSTYWNDFTKTTTSQGLCLCAL